MKKFNPHGSQQVAGGSHHYTVVTPGGERSGHFPNSARGHALAKAHKQKLHTASTDPNRHQHYVVKINRSGRAVGTGVNETWHRTKRNPTGLE